MFTLVVGGAASGKSEYAESLILAADASLPRYYIATMQPFDGECRARIAKHRRMRAAKRFATVERYTGLAGLDLPQRGCVLLECLGNLAANELYSPEGAGTEAGALRAVTDGVERLSGQCEELVVVSNEIFTDGVEYDPETQTYLRLLAAANRLLAQRADRVCEMVCGLPRYYKVR